MEVGAGGYLPYLHIPGPHSQADIIPQDMVFGVYWGYGWHTDVMDISLKYHIFKTKEVWYRPETFIHYLTLDALINFVRGE